MPAQRTAGGDFARIVNMLSISSESTACCSRTKESHIAHARCAGWATLLIAVLAHASAFAADGPAYRFDMRLDPAARTLEADVRVTLDSGRAGQTIDFLLAKPLEILESQPAVESLPFDPSQEFHGINGSSIALAARGAVARYRARLAPGESTLRLKYRGRVDFPLDTQAEEYTRGFRETPGLISTDGVYLGGSTLWYPFFGAELVSFELSSHVPEGWHLISQGNGRSRDAQSRAAWNSGGAVDEIYLVGGPLTLHSQAAGAVEAQVYLRKPEEPLARKYLAATAQYIEMYRRLIGPYPYGKFALIENFWETGYGMPSFTLLGPQIIRFPFILTSSYPHEILHNWWGNSVFVDYASGNWCEGLTAYMADHLLKEQAGQGAEFRRDTLKKYRDFVKEGRDFPLTEFRSRHSAATEAVGYGKTAMGFHMLRRQLGDDAFRKALQNFYRENRGRRASFADVRAAFEKTANRDLGLFFEQWVRRTGAPQLALREVRSERTGERFRLRGRIVQEQKGAAYALSVPLYVTTAEGLRVETVDLAGKAGEFSIETLAQPLLVELDPEFDLFRLLDPRETAPSIGQIFGEPAITAVLPSRAPPEKQAAYRRIAESWSNDTHRIEIVSDAALESLPAGRAAWVLGRENLFAAPHFGADAALGFEVADAELRAGGGAIPFAGHSAVVVKRHPGDVSKAVGWIVVDPPAAAEGLARKLPHYGRYSWLGFAGSEPANMAKGEWPTSDSPLRVDLRHAAGTASGPVQAAGAASRPKRAPLAELPPTFSAAALRQHVEWLAAPEREGRGVGTRGLDAAAEYVAQQFAAAGLAPGGADGSYFQPFRLPAGPEGKPVEVRNVIGVLRSPGTGSSEGAPAPARDVVVVTAHYDHLGFGWPNARAGEGGKVHPGADDNASGVAVLIELARAYGAAGAPQRSVVFLASSAEESGLRGTRYFLEHPTLFSRERLRAAVNIDTAGRLGDQEIQALATGSASEWPHIFRGIGFTTGIRVKSVEGAAESSDQLAFIERGIPAVQIFTGAHLDYHRPSDTPGKIDADGMVKVAAVVKEAVDYLLERAGPLTATIGSREGASATVPAAAAAPPVAASQRRVSFGTVPDFAFAGPGVRVESVVPDSPAAAAGIEAGDVLVELDGQAIANLQAYSDFLKARVPGVVVAVSLLRDGAKLEKRVTLAAR